MSNRNNRQSNNQKDVVTEDLKSKVLFVKEDLETKTIEELYEVVKATGGDIEGTPDKETCIEYLLSKNEVEVPNQDGISLLDKMLKDSAASKGIVTDGLTREQIIEALSNSIQMPQTLDTVTRQEDVAPLDSNNKVINKDVVTEEPVIPVGFIPKYKDKNKAIYKYFNGRKIKLLKNGMGMFADNGSAVVLKDIEHQLFDTKEESLCQEN